MNAPPDLEQLKQRWQAQAVPGPDVAALRERVGIDTRAHQRTLVLVGLATLLVMVVTLLYAWRSARAAAWVSFVFTTAFATVVWLVALWLSRGTWRPRDESTAAYLDVSIQRCKSVIVAAPVGILLYLAGLAGTLAWKQRLLGADWGQMLEAPSMILAGWIGAPLYSLCMLWNAKRQRRRLAVLVDLQRQLREN
jgi:hypothetical protein